jgi:hypothetical protein
MSYTELRALLYRYGGMDPVLKISVMWKRNEMKTGQYVLKVLQKEVRSMYKGSYKKYI